MPEFHLNSLELRHGLAGMSLPSGTSSPSSTSTSSGVVFAPRGHQDDEGPASPSSPRLWSKAPDPQLPTSARDQALARGRWELMEMLKDVPESYYELSFRELVDRVRPKVRDDQEEEEEAVENREVKMKRKRKRNSWEQSAGNSGLLLKMFVPGLYLRSKSTAGSGRASSKPLFVVEERESGGGGGGENWERWRKGFMVVVFGRCIGSSSAGSSNGNGNYGSSRSRCSEAFLRGCWSCLGLSRSKSDRK
ncbi:uncharacterized protein LOC116266740 isoform X2 [Nymphaea colorata]|uniref:uncharacterized protein LOC116266740 isoform X2 n=1 Tax=Nymphaea colorata TaxID=210225 RepID=UPI00129E46A4|nr:uncharacterized protein LOC116266740 isoform X2 [Nymphaea colorata]